MFSQMLFIFMSFIHPHSRGSHWDERRGETLVVVFWGPFLSLSWSCFFFTTGCSSDYDCTHHGRCRSGVCRCDFYCPAESRKVCTSNGKEFDSECEVKKHMCETKEWIPFSTEECLREGSGSGASGGIDVVLEHRNSHGGGRLVKTYFNAHKQHFFI